MLALSERLRADGIETLLDQYVNGSPQQGWPRWMLDQLDAADFVLVVCTPTCYRRFRGHEEPGKGKGADWEGVHITREIYDSRSLTLKFVPVFLSAAVEGCVPEPLRALTHCALTHYALTSGDAYQRLYDFLLGQAGVAPLPVGALKTKARRTGTALTFGEPLRTELAKPDISRIIKYARRNSSAARLRPNCSRMPGTKRCAAKRNALRSSASWPSAARARLRSLRSGRRI